MKTRQILAFAALLAAGATSAMATVWYVNDTDTANKGLDVYCTELGNDANDGQSPATPKASLSLVLTNLVQAGDTVKVDTGIYTDRIEMRKGGSADSPIHIVGSPNGSVIRRAVRNGVFATWRINHLLVEQMIFDQTDDGQPAAIVTAGTNIRFEHCRFYGGISGLRLEGCTSNVLEGCTMVARKADGTGIVVGDTMFYSCVSNRFLHCSVSAPYAAMEIAGERHVAEVTECVLQGGTCILSSANVPSVLRWNVLDAPSFTPQIYRTEDVSREGWTHNLWADAGFVVATGWNLHLSSPYGHVQEQTNSLGFITNRLWMTNKAASLSLGIDFSDKTSEVGTEPAPNGGRRNAGAYGGTEWASKSPAGRRLLAVAYRRGGNIVGGAELTWVASGFGDGEKVSISYSKDGGASWKTLATNVPAANESWTWKTVKAAQESANGAWKVTSESDGTVSSATEAPIGIRTNSATTFSYYVNDASTADDVYGMSTGSETHSGVDKTHPKATLKGILDTYQLLPGDTVYVDTGVYADTTDGTNYWTTALGPFDAGSADRFVNIRGSTNPRGTVFSGSSKTRDVVEVSGAYYDIRDIRVTGGRCGVCVQGTSNRFERITATGNTSGVLVTNASGTVLDRLLAWNNTQYGVYVHGGTGNTLDHSVSWENGTASVSGAANTLSVYNSVLGGGEGTVFGGSDIPLGDYNVAKAPAMSGSRQDLAALLAVAPPNSWGHTVARDPKFKNATEGDFRLATNSPAIDAGNPDAAFELEPSPNGNRLNIGLYGNTTNATKSATNAWLQLLSFVDGGTLDTSVPTVIRWNAGNLPAGATLTLWLKRGTTWEVLATGLKAEKGEYEYWKAVEGNLSARGAYLKLTLDSNPQVSSETETPMTYKDGTFPYYVNDASSEGDVYCSKPGSVDGDGLSPDTPVLSLEALMSMYKFSAGETIYVDTGTYATNRKAWVINDNMAGSEAKPIRIIGSTNAAAGGSVIGNRGSRQPVGMVIGAGAQHLEISNLTFTNVNGNAVTVSNAVNVTLTGVQVRGATGTGISVLGEAENISVKHSAATGCQVGLSLAVCTNVDVSQCVFVDNMVGVSATAKAGAMLENSALSANADGAVLYQVAPGAFKADYNGVHAGGNARVSSGADDLHAWQKASGGLDTHGVPGDPLFANPGAFDYHLMTKRTRGRWMDDGNRTADEENSPLLAAGRPGQDGTRPNIGMHGGTPRASLPPTGEWLRALSFNDAGGVGAETVTLCWVASEAMSNKPVKIEVSVDGGKIWKRVTNNVPAWRGEVAWKVGTTTNTPAALWRVSDSNVTDACDAYFAVRKAPLKIYVATGDTNDTVYVKAPGKADNWQATPDAPLDSLSTVLENFDLEGGDTIYVDHGTYALTAGMKVGLKQSGNGTNAVRIVGITNKPFNGTTLALGVRSSGSVLLDMSGAHDIRFEALTFSNAWTGIQARNATGIEFGKTRITHMVTNAISALEGADLALTHGVVDDCLFAGVTVYPGAVVRVNHGYVAASAQLPFRMLGGTVGVTNSVLAASGLGNAVYSLESAVSQVVSDYNDIRAENSANVAMGTGRAADRFLYDWQRSSSNDMHSVGYVPQMFNEGEFDYHLQSAAGRYDSDQKKWVKDKATSRLIDLGAPDSISTEPKPNGDRVNIGVYGGTPEASKSAVTNFIVPLTMSDGGTIRGEVDLHWTYSANYSGNERVNVLLSVDGGKTWTNIQTNVYLNTGMVKWNSTNANSTAQGMWRVELASNHKVYGQTETPFAIKNEPLTYYVNDGDTNGDVYCQAKGLETNNGSSPKTPIDTLEHLFGRYKLEPGDVVYVDTGVYRQSGSLVLNPGFEADTNSTWLVIQGSTNVARGTVLTNEGTGAVLELRGTTSTKLRNMVLAGGTHGLYLNQSSGNEIQRVVSDGALVNAFDLGVSSTGNRFFECAALHFGATGMVMQAVMKDTDPISTNYWDHGVFSTREHGPNINPVATGICVAVTSGRFYVSNSVFQLNASQDTAIDTRDGGYQGDYNAFHLGRKGGTIGKWTLNPAPTFGMHQKRATQLDGWRALSGQDGNSVYGDPLWGNTSSYDFHPQSAGGRWTAAGTVYDHDVSILVANGVGGANIGWYGSGAEASRPPTNAWLTPLTFRDGGVAKGMTTLAWKPLGNVKDDVTVQLVVNGKPTTLGKAAASAGKFDWDTTKTQSSGAVRWQLMYNGSVREDNGADFSIRNEPLTYYVNDDSREGDKWCSAVGSSENTGLTTNAPLSSLSELLDRYDLEAGDEVRIDAGTYQWGGRVTLGWEDSGKPGNPVVIRGTPHGKTIIEGTPMEILQAQGVTLQDLWFANAAANGGVHVTRSENIRLSGVDVVGSRWNALQVQLSSNVWADHCLFVKALTNGVSSLGTWGLGLDFCTVCSNGLAQISMQAKWADNKSDDLLASWMGVSNSILAAAGTRVPIYDVRGTIFANHNDLYTTDGGLVALTHEGTLATERGSVNAWYNFNGQDAKSLSHEPGFADTRFNNDFHLMSSAGRYVPSKSVWTNADTITSILIDAGNPKAAYTNEPTPNGGRANLGRYGGTDEASKTPEGGELVLVALNDGGKASGDAFPITWLARGSWTTNTLKISYWSGSEWTILTNGIAATNEIWYWNTTNWPASVQGKLRLESSDGVVVVENEKPFSLRNEGDSFSFYVNDGTWMKGDYCTAAGDNDNDGLSPKSPMKDLNALLAKYDLEGGDIVYVDAGLYQIGIQPWRITQGDSAGVEGKEPVIIQGATNIIQGATNQWFNGTVLDRQGNAVGISAEYTVGLKIRNIAVSNASEAAFSLVNTYETVLEWCTARDIGTGASISGGSKAEVNHCVFLDVETGVSASGSSRGSEVGVTLHGPVIQHNVLKANGAAVLSVGGDWKSEAKHNVFIPATKKTYAYSVGSSSPFESDYNAIWTKWGGRVSEQKKAREESPVPVVCETVGAWVNLTGNDVHSYDGDPGFAHFGEDDGADDFHLKSRGGRYNPATKKFVKDEETSALVDAGNPATGVGAEPSANGGRVNIGLYGGTREASKSDGTGRYNLLTYNNGGVASGRVKLAWNALGHATGSTVRVEVSLDGGNTWQMVGNGIPAMVGEVLWTSADAGSSPLGKWRLVDEANPTNAVASETCFTLHNGGIAYYVNDGTYAEEGDYCMAAGDDANDGLSPESPKRNLEAILDTYNLEPGDVVYVDGGTYVRGTAVTLGDLDSGAVGRNAARVRIQGQTNENAEKSVFRILNPEADGIVLDGAYGVTLSHLEFEGATNAIRADEAYYIDGEWLTMRDGYNGVLANASSNVWLRHTLFQGNRNAGVYFSSDQRGAGNVQSSVFWSNRHGIFLEQGYMWASNNIYGVFGNDSFAYYRRNDRPLSGLQSDYNGFHLEGGHADGDQTGSGANARTSLYSRVSTWANRMGQDKHSLSQNPKFVDPGNGDFHLKSVSGHWGGSEVGWVADAESSPLIDAGGPTSTGWLPEPNPNGMKLNIGLYGGTKWASMTPQSGWLVPLTLVDGGSAAGDIKLCWQAGGAATKDTVTIEFSYDNGLTWTNTIVSGWPASEGEYLWKSGEWGATALGQWRVYSDRDGSIVGGSHTPFVLRNTGTIHYYVNNAWEQGDVYCTEAGNDENDGLTPGTPKATVQAVLAAYELEPEDVILVDAGRYDDGIYPIVIDGGDSGWSNRYVTIQGSTNPAARTVLHAPSLSEAVCALSYAENVCLRNLTLENAKVGVLFDHAINCRLEGVRVEKNSQVGVSLTQSEGTELSRTLLWNNVSTGGVAVAFQQSGGRLNQCVVWGSPKAISVETGDAISISNSVLDARSELGRIYSFGENYDGISNISADYNAYHLREGAIVGEQAKRSGGNDLYNDLLSWVEASLKDRHSVIGEQLGFVDPEDAGDFHLLSPAGYFTTNDWYDTDTHWVVGYGTNWSVLLDAGDPRVAITDEPEPNGGRLDIGIYGNTGEASKTPTNAWVTAMSYNTPGTITKTALLYWNFGGLDGTKERVTLEYRRGDEWQPWEIIDTATNVPLGQREYEWDVSAFPLTVALKWRIKVNGTKEYLDESDAYVAVKTKNYDYYVNDSSSQGDVYCTGVGRDFLFDDSGTQAGTNAAVPINSLASLLENYPVGAGDRVFIDTGTYELGTNAVLLTADNMGTDTSPLAIIGSTNFVKGGSVFRSEGTTNGIILQNTRCISVSNLVVTGAKHGVTLLNVSDIALDGMEIRGNKNSGIYVNNGANVSVRRSLLADNGEYGFHVASAATGSRSLENVTLANNARGAIFTTHGVQLDNSILVGGVNNTLIFLSGEPASVTGDYNLFQWGKGGGLATNIVKRQHMTSVKQWQEQSGGDGHSFKSDPLFVNAAKGDYHVQSRAGCWSNGVWFRAPATSWAIDGGNPASNPQKEPNPNGKRVNLGAYGGGAQASATDTSKTELLVMSLTDGGVAGRGQVLTWASRGIDDTANVRLEYSPDNGKTWQAIGTAKAKDGTGYEWIPVWEPSPLAQWRVVLTSNTNVWGQTGTNFTYRPTPLIYYVNDGSRSGDVFTKAVGTSTNNGYQAESPLNSVQAVLARYQLTGEDELRVDTGIYELDESVEWTGLNAGSAGQNVIFRGSTNLASKTVFMPAKGMEDAALRFAVTHDVEVKDMTFAGFTNAIAIPKDNGRIFLSNLDLQQSEGAAVSVQQANDNIYLSHVLVRDGAGDGLSFRQSKLVLDGCVVWGNAGNAISMEQDVTLSMTNSILSASGFGNVCYYSPTTTVIKADYNNLYVEGAGQVASVNGVQYDKVPQWMRATSQDIHSLSTDPLFADAENGDFHVRSVYGRYDAARGRWVKDAVDPRVADVSPMVDAGHTNSVWGDEPVPNGNRRNIGLYGGTWQASKSNTNAWLTAVTAMSGGLLDGKFYLSWIYGGVLTNVPNSLVQLEYSPRNGEEGTWTRINTDRDVFLSEGMYSWRSDEKNWKGEERWMSSPEARWRVLSLFDTNVWDASDLSFGLRNKPFLYYLNDKEETKDEWCTAKGSDGNSGFWPEMPKLTLQSLLENVDMEATDEIRVDTGTYYMDDTNRPVVWQYADGGAPGAPVRMVGSPQGATFVVSNAFAGGRIFDLDADCVAISNIGFRVDTPRNADITFNGVDLQLNNVAANNAKLSMNGTGIVCSNLTLRGGDMVVGGMSNRVTRLESRNGTVTLWGTNSLMMNSLVYTTNNSATALVVKAASAALTNCTVVAQRGTAVSKTGLGNLSMEGNILVAGGGRQNAALKWKSGGLKSDWNAFHVPVTETAWLGETEHSKWEKLMYWQRETGQDAHSVAMEPMFAYPENGDFHLSSKAGRWNREQGTFVTDGAHSPLIDMGNPDRGTGAEVIPNGDTPNLGAYARTAEASKSVTNFWLRALTANDGGVVKGTNVVLRWAENRAGAWVGRTVKLEYSADNGKTWTNIASGVSARAGEYTWDTTGYKDSFGAQWRVVCEQDGVSDASDTPFALRNRVQDFYLADQVGGGDDANDGLSTNAPMRTFQGLLDKYDLEGGDTLHVAAGDYTSETNVLVVWSRSGEEGNPVKVVGAMSTNGMAGVLLGAGKPSVELYASDFQWDGLKIVGQGVTNGETGVVMNLNRNVELSGMDFSKLGTGIRVGDAYRTTIRNSSFQTTKYAIWLENSLTNTLRNLTMVGIPSGAAGIKLVGSIGNVLENNIFVPGENAYAYEIGSSPDLLSGAAMDYNLYDFGAEGAGFHEGATNVLRKWQQAMGNDFRSAIEGAGLANTGRGDFHPKSEYGRWNGTKFVKDTAASTSFAVDHGNPLLPVGAEQKNNGSRINIGRFGGTKYASKGNTNVSLHVRSMDEPGLSISSEDQYWPLVWESHLLGTNKTVEVQWKGEAGNWTTLAVVNANQEYWEWNLSPSNQTSAGKWRVICVENNKILDESDNTFSYTQEAFGFKGMPYRDHGLMRFKWKGALTGRRYVVQYTEDYGKTWQMWPTEYNGPEKIHRSNFVMQPGETQVEYIFEDITSFEKPQRWYRLVEILEETKEDVDVEP